MTTINRRPVAGGSGGVETDPVFGTSEAASLAAGDAAKLAGIEAGAQVNVPEADPIVGAITGIPKADGAGNISAAVSWTDYANPSLAAYASLADNGYIGLTKTGIVGETVVVGSHVYLKAADSRWWKTDSSAAATMSNHPALVVAIAGGGVAGTTATLLLWGYHRNDTLYAAFTTNGAPVYASETPGLLTATAPTTVGAFLQVLGKISDVDKIIKYDPDKSVIEIGLEGVDISSVQTLTNKRITQRTSTLPSDDATLTSANAEYDVDIADMFLVADLQQTTDFGVPGGTPTNGQPLQLRMFSTAGQDLTWNAIFREIGVTKPATIPAGKWVYVGLKYNTTGPYWDIVAVATQA